VKVADPVVAFCCKSLLPLNTAAAAINMLLLLLLLLQTLR
jgi:hypothetical protein